MQAVTSPPSSAARQDISLVRGGLFFRFQQAVGLIRADQWNLGPRSAALIVICWLPLLAITHCTPEPNSLPLSPDGLPCVRPAVHCDSCVVERRDAPGFMLPDGLGIHPGVRLTRAVGHGIHGRRNVKDRAVTQFTLSRTSDRGSDYGFYPHVIPWLDRCYAMACTGSGF